MLISSFSNVADVVGFSYSSSGGLLLSIIFGLLCYNIGCNDVSKAPSVACLVDINK